MTSVDSYQLEARAASFAARGVKGSSKRDALQRIVSLMDLTTLEGNDTPDRVRALCQKGIHPLPRSLSTTESDLPPVAAICVYPSNVAIAKRALSGTSIKVASVATSFPSGSTFLPIRCQEVVEAVAAGADEIDMVMNRAAFLMGDLTTVAAEIRQFKTACGSAHLKVILETGELGDYDSVRRASQLAIDAGADFIKTSTGKINPAATMPVTLLMAEVIRDHYEKTGQVIGLKPAGGIRTAKQAWQYLVLIKETLGDEWLQPARFRLGASTLLLDVLRQWQKMVTGAYQSERYFGIE